jgi:hypothetical protein
MARMGARCFEGIAADILGFNPRSRPDEPGFAAIATDATWMRRS